MVEAGAFGDMKRPAGKTSLNPRREDDMLQDAKDALMGLGYREQEVAPVLSRVLSDGLPVASMHGELTVGSVRPSVKSSLSFVLPNVAPSFTLLAPWVTAKSTFAPTLVSLRS